MEYLLGKIKTKKSSYLILETKNGVGYKIWIFNSIKDFKLNEELKVYIYEEIKINGTNINKKIYGFKNKIDLKIFEFLISIKGIGVKKAICTINKFSAEIINNLKNNNFNQIMNLIGVKNYDEKIMNQTMELSMEINDK